MAIYNDDDKASIRALANSDLSFFNDDTTPQFPPSPSDEENLTQALLAIADYAAHQENFQKPQCIIDMQASLNAEDKQRIVAELKQGGVEVLPSLTSPTKNHMFLKLQKSGMGIEAKLTKPNGNSKTFILSGSLRVHETVSILREIYGIDPRTAEITSIMKRLRGQRFGL